MQKWQLYSLTLTYHCVLFDLKKYIYLERSFHQSIILLVVVVIIVFDFYYSPFHNH